MKLVAIMPCRNEDWVLGLSARVALMWVDHLIILIHASTDDTMKIAWQVHLENPGLVTIMEDARSTWHEMQMRQHMLEASRIQGATHIALIDADEVVTGNYLCWLKQKNGLGVAGSILQLPGVNLRGALDRMHVGGVWGSSWFSLAFKDDPRLHWSASHRDGYDYHHREPFGIDLQPYRPVQRGQGGVFHLQFVNERRLKAKHALYKCTERMRWPDKSVEAIDNLYNLAIYGERRIAGREPQWSLQAVPEAWWVPYKDLMQYLHLDREPWQEQRVRELVAEHGPLTFKGLDLFGVV